jgi:hypothetical protein
MKRIVANALCMAFFLFSCEKNTLDPALDSMNDYKRSNVVPPVTIVTFDSISRIRTITTREHDTIFSDSIYITDDEAILKQLQFNVRGRNLYFSDYALFINGMRVSATGNYMDNFLTVIPNRTVSLNTGSYEIVLRAKVICPEQIFSVKLQQDNVTITNYYYDYPAQLYGLPLSYYIQAKKQ